MSQFCSPATARNNSFTITGRRGLPFSPTEAAIPGFSTPDWVPLSGEARASAPSQAPSQGPAATVSYPAPNPLLEASDWQRNAAGQVMLVAEALPGGPQPMNCVEMR
ncbi:MAG: S-layer family protein [Synechococcales cyanobacterium RM1_1_8]|nr:S-layer family protein [Synechococcales cyanobacterium RM1_1_8]